MSQRLIDTVWGSTGATTDPGTTKANLGWIAEIPAHDFQNWWQDRMDEQVQYVQQIGIGEWIATVTYRLNAIVMSAGVLYQSQQASNVNHQTSDTAWWLPLAFLQSLPRGYIQGFIMQNNAVDVLNDLDVGAGRCRSHTVSGLSFGLDATASITKQLDVEWQEGTGMGGRASAISVAADTFYRVFVVGKPDGTLDVGFDAVNQPGAAQLLADTTGDGYDYPRQIGWIRTNASNEIETFFHDPNQPEWIAWQGEVEDRGGSFTEGAETITSNAPPDTDAWVLISVGIPETVANNESYQQWISALVMEDTFPSGTFHHGNIFTDNGAKSPMWSSHRVHVDANRQWRYRASWSEIGGSWNPNVEIVTPGYFYNRGSDDLL